MHDPAAARVGLTRWRQRLGEEKMQTLLQESLATAVRLGTVKPCAFT